MMRTLLAILLFPLLVQAAGEGMWQASSVGVTLNHRGLFRYTGDRTVAIYLGSAWRWAVNSAAKGTTE